MKRILGLTFDPEVFRSKDGAETPPNFIPRLECLYGDIQFLIAELGDEMGADWTELECRVLSGYRSPEHNRKVGGAGKVVRGRYVPTSQHCFGRAADIQVRRGGRRVPPPRVYRLADRFQRTGWMVPGGLGLYDNFVHIDIRGELRRWKGTK